MAKGVINLQKESGGVTKITSTDGATNTELVLPESGNIASVDTAVTDNAIARYDGTTGKLQNSGVIVDDNGNVGIGVTPSAWRTIAKAVQLGASGSIESLTNNGSYVALNANNYNNGSNDIYINTAAVTKYQQLLGTHSWYTAPGGTAGNPITWTVAMTLGGNGNLLIGTSTDNGIDKLQVNGSISQGEIPAITVDLNTLTTLTKTYVVTNISANNPIDDYGYLEIIVHGVGTWVMQRFTTLGTIGAPGRVFIRCLVSGTWSAWTEK